MKRTTASVLLINGQTVPLRGATPDLASSANRLGTVYASGGNFLGRVLAIQGSAAAPSFSIVGDDDTGWFRSAANTFGITTAGKQRVAINALGVGIGHTSITEKLDVAGNLSLRNGLTATELIQHAFYVDDLDYERLRTHFDDTTNEFIIASEAAGTGVNRPLRFDSDISNNGGQSRSEIFGRSASVTGGDALAVGSTASAAVNAVALGRAATATGSQSVAIGQGAQAIPANTVAIGFTANASGTSSFAVGRSATAGSRALALGNTSKATGTEGVAIGNDAVADNTGAVAIGFLTRSLGFASVVIGRRASATASNQCVIGSDLLPINQVHIGNGVTNAIPVTTTYHGTGGSGTDVAGADIIIAGGQGTGTGVGGSVKLQTAPAGATGTAANALVDGAEVDDDTTAGNTRFLLYDVDNGALQRVSVGAADSGGTGFKVLRIPN